MLPTHDMRALDFPPPPGRFLEDAGRRGRPIHESCVQRELIRSLPPVPCCWPLLRFRHRFKENVRCSIASTSADGPVRRRTACVQTRQAYTALAGRSCANASWLAPVKVFSLHAKKEGDASPLLLLHLQARYGTVNGRSPSTGKRPVGPATVDGCARNR